MKTLRRNLTEIIELRNRWAHGTLVVHANDMSVWIEFYNDGTKVKERVSDTDFDTKKVQCDDAHAALWSIHKALESHGFALPELGD